MLEELQTVLANCRPDASRQDYLVAIRDDNCLGKRSAVARKADSQHLSQLYALDANVLLFRIMRRCWYAGRNGQALLAMLLGLARDPILRETAPAVLRLQPGEVLDRQQMTDALSESIGMRLKESTLGTIVRNAASSWSQSGHLKGHSRKVRQRIAPAPVTTAFALVLGYLTGTRGATLFETLWAQVLDAPASELIHLAVDARRLGFLDIRQSGGVIDVAFPQLLDSDERRQV